MMDLKAQLMEDLKTAMRQHDDIARDTIRLARAAIINAEIRLQHEISDAEVVRIISKEVDLRKEAAEELQRAGRDDLAARELADVAVLVRYLPEPMTEDQIRAQARVVIEGMGASSLRDMGPVMRELMGRLSGHADGGIVSRIVVRC
ncbi:MAG: GatB/YqeY domain-containing protein [Anaerolineae bacterium]